MTLVIPALSMPILAILALNQVLFSKMDKKDLFKAIKWSAGIAGGVALLFALLPDLAGNFVSASDGNYQEALRETLQADRRTLLRTDAFRSFIFVGLAAGLILLYKMEKVKANVAIALMAVLFLADMWPVNKRYINKEHFSSKRQAEQPYAPTAADQFILGQPGENNRVLNLAVSPFQDASTSFFHSSLGGYHGAKMRLYQDMIETGMMADINALYTAFQSQDYAVVDSALALTNVLNMVNTQFIVLNPETQPILNRHAAGNAWFVNRVRVMEDADAEMAALAEIVLSNEATMDRRYEGQLQNSSFPSDPTASIALTEYQPNRMVYSSQSASEQLAVFSEMYYDAGWQAYMDGEKVDHLRVNYMLRGLEVPAGAHEIIFEFHPRSYYAGSTFSLISSVLLLLLFLGALYLQFNGKTKDENELLPI